MPSATQTTVEAYLSSSFEDGDLEYVDGELQAINAGEIDHSAVQAAIGAWFFARRRTLKMVALTAMRTRVSASRFRLPDLAVVRGGRPLGTVLTQPPFLIVEILSPKDDAGRVRSRIDDYQHFGVEWIWLIDPRTGSGDVYHRHTRTPVTDGQYRTASPAVEMDFAKLFD